MSERRDNDIDTHSSDRPVATFEDVDWDEIDLDTPDRTRTQLAWIAIMGTWTVAVLIDLLSRYAIGSDPFAFPVIGTVTLVDWLWSGTLIVLTFYGIVPLYENPRMTNHYWKRFKRNKAALISGMFLIVIFIIGIVGSRFLPDAERTPGLESQPPVFMSIERYFVGTHCPGGEYMDDGITMCRGSWEYPLGTTGSGEDILLLSIHGMEVSMQVGLIATLMSITVAATVGLTAAYYGGLVDEVLMRYVDLQMTFPTFFLYLLLAYTIGGSLFVLIMIFGLTGWGAYARIMRSEALQRRQEPYMMASKSAGAPGRYAMRRHLLPNISNSVITAATLSIPGIILAEAAIAFLGLSEAGIPSWGRVIAVGREHLTSAWWISTIPGIFLFLTILAFNFLGDALRDALDPRHGGND